jgi:hypothetical protein
MSNDIYSEKVYLTGNIEARNEIMRRKRRNLNASCYELSMYRAFFKEYEAYIIKICDFLRSLDLKSSIEYSLALSYMVENGYLSITDTFKKEEETQGELLSKFGATILFGKGCCRNITDLHRDVFRILKIFIKRFYCYEGNELLFSKTMANPANHVISLIRHEDKYYGIDLFNGNRLYRFKNALELKEIGYDAEYKIRYKPYYEVIFGENNFQGIIDELREFKNDSKKRGISAFIYNDIIKADVLKYMEKNTPLLEEFDSEIKDTRLSLARRLKSV